MATRAQGNQVSNSFFGFCVPEKDKYGNPFTVWDGVTYADYFDFSNDYGGYGPSKSSSDFIEVYGGTADLSVGANGSPRPTGFTLHEMMEIVFGVKSFSTDLNSIINYTIEIPEVSVEGFSGYNETQTYGPQVPYTTVINNKTRTFYKQTFTYSLEESPLEPYSGTTLDASINRSVTDFTSSTRYIYDEDTKSLIFTTNAPHPKTICAPNWDSTQEGISDFGTGRANSIRFLFQKIGDEDYTQYVGTTHPASINVSGDLNSWINFDMSARSIIKAEDKFWPFFSSGDVVVDVNNGITYSFSGFYQTVLRGYEAGAATTVQTEYDSQFETWSNGTPEEIEEENKPVLKDPVWDGKGGTWRYGYGDGTPKGISEAYTNGDNFTVELTLPSGKVLTLLSRPTKYRSAIVFRDGVETELPPIDTPPLDFEIIAEGWD